MSLLKEKISQLRDEEPYSKIARAVGRSTNAIRDIELGKTADPSISLVRKLADHFQVPIDWLSDDSQDYPPPATDKDRATGLVEQALASAGLAGDMTGDERELLAAFRTMPEKLQMVALGYIIGLSGGSGQQDRAKAEAAGRVLVEERAKAQAKKSSSKKIG